MARVTPFLAFRERGEEAVRFYVSLFPNSRIQELSVSDGAGPIPKGHLLHAVFELDGRTFYAMDGGPTFSFDLGISLFAGCETQAEIDRLWTALGEGGEPSQCGWLVDRFGVSWQVIPNDLGAMLSDPEHGNFGALMEALLSMQKLDLAKLREAYART